MKPNKRYFFLWKTPTKSGWGYYFSPVSYPDKDTAEFELRILKRYKPDDGQVFVKLVEVDLSDEQF